MTNNKAFHALILIAAVITGILGVGILNGCRPSLTPQTVAHIEQIGNDTAIAQAKAHSDAAIAAAKAKAKADAALAAAKARGNLRSVNGTLNPAAHPFAAANNLVVKVRPWLEALFLINFILWMIFYGLSKAGMILSAFEAKLAVAFRWIWILSLAGCLALPFLPGGVLILLFAVCGLFCYELKKDKGNVKEAFDDTEHTFGLTYFGDETKGGKITQSVSNTISQTPAPGSLRMPIEVPGREIGASTPTPVPAMPDPTPAERT
jgi:hypothetical protein